MPPVIPPALPSLVTTNLEIYYDAFESEKDLNRPNFYDPRTAKMERAEKATPTSVGFEEPLSVCIDQFCDQYDKNVSIELNFELAFSRPPPAPDPLGICSVCPVGPSSEQPRSRPPPKPNPSSIHRHGSCDFCQECEEDETPILNAFGDEKEMEIPDPVSVADVHMFSPEMSSCLDYSADFSHLQVRAQIDCGAAVTTTNRATMIHQYRPINFRKYLRDAGGHLHQVVGEGYLKIRASAKENGPEDHVLIHCWYTPTLECTLLSPGELCNRQRKYYKSYEIGTNIDNGTGYVKLCTRASGLNPDLYIKSKAEGNLTYSYPLIAPGEADQIEDVHSLSSIATRELWHQRLCHLHKRAVADLSKKVTGMPKISRPNEDLEKCDTCITCKMRKAARGDGDTRKEAKVAYQGIHLDWGFIVQASKNSERAEMLKGINGEQAYLLIADGATDKLHGYTSGGKAPPIEWLNKFLAKYSPSVEGKYAVMDLGSELGRSVEVRKLLEKYGYEIRPTAPEASHQNAPGERPHQTIGNMIRTMLDGAGLDYKFWPYAFQMALLVHSFIDHGGRGIPHQRAGGGKPDLRRLRTFGCRVFVKPPGKRYHRLAKHCNVGIFLGYTATMKNILYWDVKTKRIKTALHAVFDEGMNDLMEPTPNARRLRQALGQPLPVEKTEETAPREFSLETSPTPFLELLEVKVKIACDDLRLGLDIENCSARNRAYIYDAEKGSSFSKLRGWKNKYRGAYIVAVNGEPAVTVKNTVTVLERTVARAREMGLDHVTLTLAPDRDSIELDRDATPRLYADQMRHFVATVCEMEDGKKLTEDEIDDVIATVTAESSAGIGQKSGFTRRRLQLRPDWQEWRSSEHKMLDEMKTDGMYGEAVHRSTLPANAKILNQIWTYVIKKSGTKKARNCCNGSKLKVKGVQAARHYAACVSQQGMKTFFALAALFGYVIYDADAVNAYAQADGPDEPYYVWVDEQYRDWYKERYDKVIPKGYVLKANKATQGHPEAGRLWADKIEGNIKLLGFENPTHETCLYRGKWEGQDVLICRQVDDFMFAAKDKSVCNSLAKALRDGDPDQGRDSIRLTISDKPVTAYNGLDIEQTKDYVKINVASYIEKILEGQGWTKDGKQEAKDPIRPDKINDIQHAQRPTTQKEADAIADKMPFSYRAALGELIYAYVTCRPDIGYAIALLAKYSNNPAEIHFEAVKDVYRYLRRTKDDGIIFWRTQRRDDADLPDGTEVTRPIDEDDALVPHPKEADQLGAYFDAAYATCPDTRRSTGAFIITLGGSAIYYKAKWMPTVATSSTEAEFMAAVNCAKAVKYFRSILDELGVKQVGPTKIYGDNVACCHLANAGKPTERARHIDIQYFAIQEWTARQIVSLDHIPGRINFSDALTKALGSILQHRHCTRMMGYAGSPYTSTYGKITTKTSSEA